MEHPGVIGAGWVVAAVLFAAAFRPAPSREHRDESVVARRVIWQFFFTIALPVLLVLAALIAPLFLIADIDSRIWQALVAGVFIATGWLTTAIFNELATRRGKAERLRDYHKAIFAEIRDTLATFASEGQADEEAAALIARMEREPDFVPFVARETHDRLFSALIEDIEVLPRQTIDAIVAYYSLVGSISAVSEDMRGQRYADLEPARRVLIYRDYMEMRKRAYQIGLHTLELINAYASGGADAADAVTARARSRGEDRSDRSPGSE